MKKVFLIILAVFFISCSNYDNQLFSMKRSIDNSQINDIKGDIGGSSSYKIAPHDRISIYFYKYPELSTQNRDGFVKDEGVEVDDDGTVLLPLVKRVRVVGLSKSQLQRKLYDMYSKYLQDPSLKVEILNKKVYVLGEVKNPGSIDLNKYSSLNPLKAIVERGGLSDFADIHHIKVLRSGGSNYHLANIDLSNTNSLRVRNLKLRADDVVYVPHNSSKKYKGISPTLNVINTILNALSTFKTVSK